MKRFLLAHGYDAGPMQRPLLAGALSGAIAAPVALLVLWRAGAAEAYAEKLLGSATQVLLAHALFFLIAGVLYGRVFQRAANDRRGGWLFGLVFGFLLHLAGPHILLQLIARQPLASGAAAMGVLAAHLLWGVVMGAAFPLVHRPLQRRLKDNPHVKGPETPITRLFGGPLRAKRFQAAAGPRRSRPPHDHIQS